MNVRGLHPGLQTGSGHRAAVDIHAYVRVGVEDLRTDRYLSLHPFPRLSHRPGRQRPYILIFPLRVQAHPRFEPEKAALSTACNGIRGHPPLLNSLGL
jgi:hypothetical protein